MPFSTYLDTQLGSTLFSGTAWTPPTTLWVLLSSSEPTQDVGGSPAWNLTEPSGNGYARGESLATAWALTATQPSVGAQWANTTAVQLPVSTGAWLSGVDIPYAGIVDAQSAGNLLAYGELLPNVTIPSAGYAPVLGVGQIVVSLV